jgi:hypothetical protein
VKIMDRPEHGKLRAARLVAKRMEARCSGSERATTVLRCLIFGLVALDPIQ